MNKIFAILATSIISFDVAALPKKLLSHWKNPSLEDLRIVQDFLDRRFIDGPLQEYGFRTDHVKSFKLFAPDHSSYALHIKKGSNSSICVMCYSSINPRYLTDLYHVGMQRIIQGLQDYNFSGDILYRIGGWPNMESGGILLCDTPYSFKLCAFEEALRLGYKQALWLDLSVNVLTDLSQVFESIKQNGAYFRKSFHPFNAKNIITPSLALTYNIPIDEFEEIPHYATGILGLDLENPRALQLLKSWHQLAEQQTPFKSCFPEQVPFSFLVNKYHLHQGLCPPGEIVFERDLIRQNTQFLIQY